MSCKNDEVDLENRKQNNTHKKDEDAKPLISRVKLLLGILLTVCSMLTPINIYCMLLSPPAIEIPTSCLFFGQETKRCGNILTFSTQLFDGMNIVLQSGLGKKRALAVAKKIKLHTHSKPCLVLSGLDTVMATFTETLKFREKDGVCQVY